MGGLPKRILFYDDGVSEGEFETILNEELPLIRKACEMLGFDPKITLIVVGKYHKVVLYSSPPIPTTKIAPIVAATVSRARLSTQTSSAR